MTRLQEETIWQMSILHPDDDDRDQYDYDDRDPDEEPEEDPPEGYCACGDQLCMECGCCHICNSVFIESGDYEQFPCYPDHPGIPPELKLPEGL